MRQFNACRVDYDVNKELPIFTIGHSTRTIAELVDVLHDGPADLVVDVRTVPRSRTNPQYNIDSVADALAPFQVGYMRIAELGGLRGRAHDIDPKTNALWRNRSFHNYADYALSHDFADGLGRLLEISRERRCAIMCAEAVWWRCHRRIISDYLLARGRTVCHLMGGGKVSRAQLTPGAHILPRVVIYPEPV